MSLSRSLLSSPLPCVAWALLALAATAKEPAALSEAEFKKLHTQLQPPKDEPWRGVPWKDTIHEARDEAAAQKRPVFMLVRSGHPLGCV